MDKLTWYRVFHQSETDNLPYVEKDFDLEGYGDATVRLCRGTVPALMFEGQYLVPELNGRNPFITLDGKFGATLDAQGYVWLGIKL